MFNLKANEVLNLRNRKKLHSYEHIIQFDTSILYSHLTGLKIPEMASSC